MPLPRPVEIKEFFLETYAYREIIKDCKFSTHYTRTKLILEGSKQVDGCIALYLDLKKANLTNLHMTYIEKEEKLCIYFEIDQRLSKLLEPPNPVSTAFKELF